MSSPILSVHLGSELKARWTRYCKSRDVTPSTAIKQVINHLLTGKAEQGRVTEINEVPDASRVRLEIKLSHSELKQVELIAESAGYSRNLWVANLVRSYLTKAPQFGMRELEILSESNSQLLRIGRNLNQITRQLNMSLAEADSIKGSDIEQLSNDISAHVRFVSTVIQANIERWKLK